MRSAAICGRGTTSPIPLRLERGAASVSARLPRADDLVPASLARRLLSQAQSSEVSRMGSVRVAGRDAAGLRYVPAQSQSTIDHIDVWVLPGSGLPVKVAVYDKSDTAPVLATTMLDLSTQTPAASTTAFTPAAGVKVAGQQAPDILALASRIKPQRTPSELAGLPRDSISPPNSAVVVYGSGVTVLAAIPVFGRTGDQLRDQLTKAVGSTSGDAGTSISIGLVNLLMTKSVSSAQITGRSGSFSLPISWLLVGTVTASALDQGGTDLLTGTG